jgi:hypothetical protein
MIGLGWDVSSDGRHDGYVDDVMNTTFVS